MTPSKAAFLQTTLLETLAGSAGTQVVAAELFFQHLVAMDGSLSTLHVRFRGKSASSLTHRLEKTVRCRSVGNDSSRTFLFCREFGSPDTSPMKRFTRTAT
ncbi:MAG: hypothetical protein ACI93T_000373 [Porticoccaceae bacterium]|jgi:hypothetical protein